MLTIKPRIAATTLICAFAALAISTQTSAGNIETMPMGDKKAMTYQIPLNWQHSRFGEIVHLTTKGIHLSLQTSTWPDVTNPKDQASIEKHVVKFTQTLASKSVEKKATLLPIKGMIASYAIFTDAAQVGKEITDRKFKKTTAGTVRFGDSLINFYLTSNELDSKKYKQAFAIITSLKYHNPITGPHAITPPGKKWKVTFESPAFKSVRSGETGTGYMVKASTKQGLLISVFVIEPIGDKRGHPAVMDYFWNKAKRNPKDIPILDKTTVKIKPSDNHTRVSYWLRGGPKDRKWHAPHTHLYKEYKGMWIDVHVSMYNYKETDLKLMDKCVKSLKFERIKNSSSTNKTLPTKRETN